MHMARQAAARKMHDGWMRLLVPISAIRSGMRIFIPLYILQLGGNAFDVGIAFALSSLFAIAASIGWGKATDAYRNGKFYVAFSFAAALPIFALLYYSHSIGMAFLVYGLYSAISVASAPSLNIMLMGKKETRMLGSRMAQFNMFATAGFLLAYIAGTGTDLIGVSGYLNIVILLNVIGLALSLMTKVRSGANKAKVPRIVELERFIHALTAVPGNVGEALDNALHRRWSRGLPSGNNKQLHTLFLSIVLFNMGFYLFYTPYVPFLHSRGISAGGIFFISLIGIVGQGLVYFGMLKRRGRDNQSRKYFVSVLYRIAAFAMITASAAFAFWALFATNIVANLLYGFSYGVWNIASTYKLYDKIRGKRAGYYIGVWVALSSLTSVFGALIGGYLGNINFAYSMILGIAFTASAAIALIGHEF